MAARCCPGIKERTYAGAIYASGAQQFVGGSRGERINGSAQSRAAEAQNSDNLAAGLSSAPLCFELIYRNRLRTQNILDRRNANLHQITPLL